MSLPTCALLLEGVLRIRYRSLPTSRLDSIMAIKMALFAGIVLAATASFSEATAKHSAAGANLTRVIDSLLEGYDKRVRPNYGGPSVEVGVSIYVLAVASISEKDMDWTVVLYFRQFWTDPRLDFDSSQGNIVLTGDREVIDRFWTPDTFFVNEKKIQNQRVTTDDVFFRIKPGGEVLSSVRLTVKASCPMDLQRYPMDIQVCYLEIESFGHTMADTRYKWNGGAQNSVQVSSDVSTPEFRLSNCRLKTIEASLSTGNYSRLAMELLFVRSSAYVFLNLGLPCIMGVVLSWLPFWMDTKQSALRVCIGFLLIILMTLILGFNQTPLPTVVYFKAIDFVTGISMTFVCLAVMEYALIDFLTRQTAWEKRMHESSSKICRLMTPLWIDRVSRALFPVAFVTFHVIFWITFASNQPVHKDFNHC